MKKSSMKPHAARAFCFVIAALALLLQGRPAEAQGFNAFKDPVASSGGSGQASGPDLKATTDKIDGGHITVGATAYVVALFTNNGTSPVKVLGINLYPSSTVSAQVSLNKCADEPLPPEGQCAVTVAVTGLQLGAWRVEILLDHDGRTRLATAAMTGTVEPSSASTDDVVKADIEAVPESLDFGNATGSVPLVRSVLLRNRTSDKVTLSSLRLDVPDQSGFQLKPECPEALAPSESCLVNVTWSPVTRGLTQGVLMINHTAKSSVTRVDVRGSFEPAQVSSAQIYPESVPDMGLLVADKTSIDFGAGIKSVAATTVSLVNSGAKALTLNTIRLAGAENGLSVARSGCHPGLILKPIEACALTINWVPVREGSVIDDLQILHSGARGVLILPIRGTASAAASRESIAVRQPVAALQGLSPPPAPQADKAKDKDKTDEEESAPPPLPDISEPLQMAPVLDGYVVTSHSPTKAVINGPVGSLVVRDGEDVVISGVKWTVTIVSTGVILSSDEDEILLLFDRSLRAKSATSSSSSSSGSNSNSTSNNNGGTTE